MLLRRLMRFSFCAPILLAGGLTGQSIVAATLDASSRATHRAAIGVSPPTASVALGGTQQFTANVSSGVTWSASEGTISATGLFRAPRTMPASPTVVINATTSRRTGTAKVTLIQLKSQTI